MSGISFWSLKSLFPDFSRLCRVRRGQPGCPASTARGSLAMETMLCGVLSTQDSEAMGPSVVRLPGADLASP